MGILDLRNIDCFLRVCTRALPPPWVSLQLNGVFLGSALPLYTGMSVSCPLCGLQKKVKCQRNLILFQKVSVKTTFWLI